MTIEKNITAAGFEAKNKEDIQNVAPAAFSRTFDSRRSDKYSFVPTYHLINMFEKLGWNPTHAKQDGTSAYSRHFIRMDNEKLSYLNVNRENVEPQIILDNSHNGVSPAQIHIGLFRLVCGNGLVVSMPGMYTNVKFRHMGVDFKELENLMVQVSEQYLKLGNHIEDMRRVELNNDQKEQFAISAVAHRNPEHFINEDGTINERMIFNMSNPKELTKPVREEDRKNDLWSTFNILQERMVKGRELFPRKSPNGRKSSPRPIINAKRNIDYNRKLWEVAETYMPEEV